jgi:hypothetical protein
MKWSYSGNGDLCSTSGDTYGRGMGYLYISSCENDAPYNGGTAVYNPELGCEESTAFLAFPKCSPGYSSSTSIWCLYDGGCPGPFMFGGSSPCNKAFYDRVGHCPTGLVFGTDGFCHPKCISGYDGGKVCYQTCPTGTIPCGDVLCLTDAVCPAIIPAPAVNVKSAVNAAVGAGK